MPDAKGRIVKGEKRTASVKRAISKGLLGNQSAVKLKEPRSKQEAYKSYCEHIATGRCKEGWTFEDSEYGITLTHRTMEKYIKESPSDFPSHLKEAAEAKSLTAMESEGFKLMQGQYKNGSPEVWKTFMRNKFGWDKESRITHTFEPEARTLLKKWEATPDNVLQITQG